VIEKGHFEFTDFDCNRLVLTTPATCDRREHLRRSDLPAKALHAMQVRQHPVVMTACMREPMTSVAGPSAINPKKFMTDFRTRWAEKNLPSKARMIGNPKRKAVDENPALSCGDLAPSVGGLQRPGRALDHQSGPP